MSAPKLLLLHGWTMRGASFAPLVERLNGITCFAPDLPGHGCDGGGLQQCVDLVKDLIEREGQLVVLGWSMGAAVAWKYVETFGSQALAGLITVDMSPRIWNGPGWDHGLIRQDAKNLARTTEEIHHDWPRAAQKIATTMFADREGTSLFSRDAALDLVLSNAPDVMATYWDDMAAMDLRAVPARIDCPSLIAHGARSRVYPASAAEWLAAQTPRARRVRFEASGHSPHLEEPDLFAEHVQRFVDDAWCRG